MSTVEYFILIQPFEDSWGWKRPKRNGDRAKLILKAWTRHAHVQKQHPLWRKDGKGPEHHVQNMSRVLGQGCLSWTTSGDPNHILKEYIHICIICICIYIYIFINKIYTYICCSNSTSRCLLLKSPFRLSCFCNQGRMLLLEQPVEDKAAPSHDTL